MPVRSDMKLDAKTIIFVTLAPRRPCLVVCLTGKTVRVLKGSRRNAFALGDLVFDAHPQRFISSAKEKRQQRPSFWNVTTGLVTARR